VLRMCQVMGQCILSLVLQCKYRLLGGVLWCVAQPFIYRPASQGGFPPYCLLTAARPPRDSGLPGPLRAATACRQLFLPIANCSKSCLMC